MFLIRSESSGDTTVSLELQPFTGGGLARGRKTASRLSPAKNLAGVGAQVGLYRAQRFSQKLHLDELVSKKTGASMEIVSAISLGIGVIGVAVIVWGSLVSLGELCHAELRRLAGTSSCKDRNLVRQHYGFYLLMGLEYMIGADIVRTLIRPTLQELAILGSLVAIRTVTSFFLNREMTQASAEERKLTT
jgi:uncharacterized membrane protein